MIFFFFLLEKKEEETVEYIVVDCLQQKFGPAVSTTESSDALSLFYSNCQQIH